MFKSVLSALFCLLSIYTFAGSIKGTVIEEKNASPLVGVVVSLKGTDKGIVTDIDGKYELAGIKPGDYEVTFTYITFITETRKISIKGKEDITIDVKMKEEIKELKEVGIVAKKITHTEAAVINEIKASNAVVSGTSSSQISKTMDRNAADVVKRIPGVAIQDDRFIVVRGLSDRYNTVWLNDAGAPSSESDKKSFSFDIIPAGLIDRVLIFKTPSAELPGDFAGGMVKIYTTSLQDKNSISVNLQTSSRQGTTGQQFTYNSTSPTDKWGFDDGSRSLPSEIPSRLSKSTNPEMSKLFKNDWQLNTKNAGPDMRLAIGMSGVKKFKKITAGASLGVSYTSTSTIFDVERKDWDSESSNYFYKDKISTTNSSIGLLGSGGISVGNTKIEFKNLYSQVGRAYTLDRSQVVDSENPPEQHYIMSYESKATYASQLTGTHKSKNDDIKYNWTLGYTDVYKNQPNLRRIKYVALDTASPYQAAIANTTDPNFGGGRTYISLYEHTYSFNHQFSKRFHLSPDYAFTVNAGNYLEAKRRSFDLRWFSYTLNTIRNPGATKLKQTDINNIFADSNVGATNKFLLDEGTNPSDRYSGSNDLVASFLSFNLPVGKKFNVVAGVRNEQNTLSILGYRSTDTLRPVTKTNHLLPSVNAAYNLSTRTIFRMAYGKTVNRPEFRESSPTYYYDFEEIAIVKGSLAESATNPTGAVLKTAEIQNMDVRYEYYPSSGEIVHAGFFYKSIKNSIQRVIDFGTAGETKTLTYLNAEKAYVAGIEIDVRKNMAFADKIFGTKIFRDFTFSGNLAFSKSELTIDTARYVGQMRVSNLQGQSPYLMNMGLYYQNDETGFKGSVLYNVNGPRVFATGHTDNGGETIGELPFHSLDVTVSKIFFKHYSLNIGMQNVLNAQVRFIKDINRDNKFDLGNADLEYRTFRPGRYFTVGLKVNF